MKYQQEKEILAQMQLLNDLVQNQDKQIQELKKQVAGVDEEEEKLRDECLKADLKAFHSRPKWERVQVYKNDDEYTQEWLEHWEEDPRLLKYRENRDGKSESDTTEPKPKSKPKSKSEPKPKSKPKRISEQREEVKGYVEQGYSLTDIETFTGVDNSTISVWINKFKWNRNLRDGTDRAVSSLPSKYITKDIASMEVTSERRVEWEPFVNEEKLIAWFKENNVIDEESEMWQKDVASEYAAYVGLDNISQDIESYDQMTKCSRLSERYYQKLGNVIRSLIKQEVLHKETGTLRSWQTYGDVLDEDGEPVIGDDGYILQELKGRASRMNILYLNLEMVQ